MLELNVKFQEQYKRLDKLCKEMYSSAEGVSAYIQDMECTPYKEQRIVYNWDAIFRELKHVRWMRNQLAHDIPIEDDFCKQSDIDWVQDFYESIINRNDPLALVYKAKQAAAQKRTPTPLTTNGNEAVQTETVQEHPRKSLWTKIISKIKSWFS